MRLKKEAPRPPEPAPADDDFMRWLPWQFPPRKAASEEWIERAYGQPWPPPDPAIPHIELIYNGMSHDTVLVVNGQRRRAIGASGADILALCEWVRRQREYA